MKKALLFPFTLLAIVIGNFSWVAPAWLQTLHQIIKNHVKTTLGMLILCIAGVVGYLYYDTLPKPVMVKAQLDSIQLTPNYSDAKPGNLNIRFQYDFSQLNYDQARPQGAPSMARIDLVGKEITSGITLSPARQGQWSWVDDRSIRFVPETDWPAGTDFSVTFDPEIFVEEAVLSEHTYSIKTPEFKASFSHIEFYQDPQDISVRRVVSTIQFTHPVDEASLEKSLSMGMRPSGENIETELKPYRFNVTYDKNYREAYIQSAPVSLPDQSSYMQVLLAKGVTSILGGESSTTAVETKALIPDVFSFLKINTRSQIVRNQQNEPEQVVMLDFTDDIAEKELLAKISIHLLPKKGQRNGKNNWKSPRQVGANVLRDSEKIDYSVIPNERNYSKLFSLKVDVPENRYLYVRIDKGLTSVNNFVYSSFYDNVLRTPKYPKEVNISGEGSVLTYSGNHELSVLTRGVPALKYSVGRLLEGQIYHLISQTSGDITNPRFNNWGFSEQNIADFETTIVRLNGNHPKNANYSSIDLSQYLPEQSNRFGLFFVDIKGYDLRRKREIYEANDKRLILVTDLGVIVKNNADHSHELFVQSVTSGDPVAQAQVELLGKNGVAVFTGITDTSGHISIPSTKTMKQEKAPTVYVVKSGGDLSFIPFNRSSRQINLSRFDIGGVHSSNFNRDSLNAYVFTDRGIYRPGETINIGMIVKNFELSNVEKIPLELVVTGPRNKNIKVNKFKLPKMGFAEFQFPTSVTSDTGRYRVSLHLVRDNRYRGRKIGSVNFKVEEFQPDTMKIQSKLLDIVDKGWNTQEKITARVNLNNLFGTPAEDRKMSARLIIQPHNFRFKGYQDYKFTDPYFDKAKKPLSLNTALGDKRTDADGIADFELDLSKFKQGTYNLSFTAEGFDQAGGRSVIASNATLISPLETLIGYKADGKLDYINAKSNRLVEFIAIDKTLIKKQAENLKLRLIEIQHVSTLIKQHNGTYKYQTINKENQLTSEDLNIQASGFQYAIDTETPGDYALEIIDESARRLSRVHFSVVGFANLSGKMDNNAELQLKLDKSDYFPGEMIEMSIKAPYSGAGLITIETDKVHHFKWFKSSEESSVQQIRIPDNLEGTGYVNVSFVRDINSKEVFTSPLSYAVQPFSIDQSKRRIDISLQTKHIVRPGKPMDISYSTSKPSRIAIFAIDEGVLQVAKYQTPDPLSHFLKKRALDVETLQILDLILPDLNIIKELSASGGGAKDKRRSLAKNLNPFSRKTDKPAVFWSGIYDANKDTQKVVFNVPDTFAGELRVMAVAVGETSVGATSSSAIVRGPFVISPNVLTQAAPGDEFLVTVGVANIIEGSGKGASVDLSVSSSKHLMIIGKSSTQLKIDEGSEGHFTFKVKAKSVLGAAELIFSAIHKDEDGSRTASLSVRPATTYYTTFKSGFEKGGNVALKPDRSLYPDLAKQSAAASASPLVIVDGLNSYLEAFPHGCTEQVVSKVFPLVGLMSHPAYGSHLPDVKKHFSHLIDKLRERQQGDGGFAFWPGHTDSAEYPSIYVMHFLMEAGEQGFPVPSDLLQRGKDYLKSYIAHSSTSLSAARDRANAIYLLTRMGEVTTNYLVDLEEYLQKHHKDGWHKDILSAYMASTYKLLQKDQEARRLIKGYELNAKHRELNDFHSVLAIDAQYIYLLAKHFEAEALNLDGEKIHQLTDKIFKGEYNTISSAYSILALGAYSKLVLSNDFNEPITFNVLTSNERKQLLNAALEPFLKVDYAADTKEVQIESNEAIFYTNVQSGFNDTLPNQAIRNGVEIFRVFSDEKGNEVTRFEQGKELNVTLKIRALDGKLLNNIAIIDLLPGGFEVIRSSVSRTAYNWRADYVDIREDRVVYYGDFDSTVRELTYRVKLTSAGDFVIPPSYAESMYDRSIRAISTAGKFKVTASQ